jgi:hypothetical protein
MRIVLFAFLVLAGCDDAANDQPDLAPACTQLSPRRGPAVRRRLRATERPAASPSTEVSLPAPTLA